MYPERYSRDSIVGKETVLLELVLDESGVFLHLVDKGGGTLELMLITDAVHERDNEVLPIKVTGEIEDVCLKGHLAAIKRAKSVKGTEIFNLGTGKGVSVLDLINAFKKATGVDIPYTIEARRAGDVATSYADVSKANKILGWHAEKDVVDACRDSWHWQTQNPNGYNK